MKFKGMIQVLIPLIVGVAVFLLFYLLGGVSYILEWLFDAIDDIGIDNRLDRFFDDVGDFFCVLKNRNLAGRVVAIIVWLIVTIIAEIYSTKIED